MHPCAGNNSAKAFNLHFYISIPRDLHRRSAATSHRNPIVLRLRLSTGYPPSTLPAISSPPAVWSLMGLTTLTSSGALPTTSTGSSKARSQRIFRYKRQPSMSW